MTSIERMGPSLEELEAVKSALDMNISLGNALQDGLTECLKLDCDGADFDQALLFLDMERLAPLIVLWRRRFLQEAVKELKALEAQL